MIAVHKLLFLKTPKASNPGCETGSGAEASASVWALVCVEAAEVPMSENTGMWSEREERRWPIPRRCLHLAGLGVRWESRRTVPSSRLQRLSARSMDARVVLITGCSSGIGLSLAVRLASDPQKAFKGNQNRLGPVQIVCCARSRTGAVLPCPPPGGHPPWSGCSGPPLVNVLYLSFAVYATMRNLSKKERLLESVKGLHKDTLDILQMDVTSQQSILEATARIVEKRIDVLGKFPAAPERKNAACV